MDTVNSVFTYLKGGGFGAVFPILSFFHLCTLRWSAGLGCPGFGGLLYTDT